MRAFGGGEFGKSDDPWFRVGQIDVSTTILICATAILTFFIYAAERAGGPIFSALSLSPAKSAAGQIWRIFTWFIPTAPSFWTVIAIVLFYIFGSLLEAHMGRRKYTILIAGMVVLPALFMTVLNLFFALPSINTVGTGRGSGISLLELGLLVAYIAVFPNTRFFFGIKGWVLAAVFVGISTLQLLGVGFLSVLLFQLLVVGVGLLGVRAMGFVDEWEWIPKVPLPASLGGDPYYKANKERTAQQKRTAQQDRTGQQKGRKPKARRSRGRANLQAVPSAPPVSAADELEMDALLDKVADGGLESLTREQRKQLEDYSKRLRKRNQ